MKSAASSKASRAPSPNIAALLFWRFTVRHWIRSPRQSALLVILLALGVAVYFSIRLANRAAVASFQNFTDLITAQSDWVLTPISGSLPQSVLSEIRQSLGNRPVVMVPVVETTAAPLRTGVNESIGTGPTYTLVGVDLIAIRNGALPGKAGQAWVGRSELQSQTPNETFQSLFRDPHSIFISRSLSAKLGLKIDATLPVVVHEQALNLRVAGWIPEAPGRPAPPENLLVMDLPALQFVAAKEGRLDRIEFLVEPGFDDARRREEVREQLVALGKGRWTVVSPADRRAAGATMTRAFRMNLTLLSLIALMVGLYLVFQALDGAVVRRREEIAILRSLGVEERSIHRAWINEALALGALGGLGGVSLGWLGAQVSVRLVGRTVNALYYANSAESAQLRWDEALAAFGLAIVASLAAGWWPARVAARTPPAQILVRDAPPATRGSRSLRILLGIVLIGISALLALAPAYRVDAGLRVPVAGYAAAFLGVLGTGLLCGAGVRRVARSAGKLGQTFVTARLALGHLRRPSGRHDLAAAGLVWAVAMTAGMAILVASFDQTMRGWINRAFQSDLYISSAGAQSASTQNRIAPSTWRPMLSLPGIRDANVLQITDLRLPEGPTLLVGMDLGFVARHQSFAWISAPPREFFDLARNEGMALASESFTERFQKHLGDTVDVTAATGIHRLTIVGTFADYGNERGSLTVDRQHFAAWFQDEMATSVILELQPGVSADEIRSNLLRSHPGLQVFTNAHLRTELLRIFRQTFSITYALELIGVVVAVAGLALTLVSVLLERRNELTTLRSLGMTAGEIALATAWEGGVLGAVGAFLGLCASLGLGALLVFVINKQVFGWTLRYSVPMGQMAGLGVLVTVAAAAASYAVGRWGANLPSDREE